MRLWNLLIGRETWLRPWLTADKLQTLAERVIANEADSGSISVEDRKLLLAVAAHPHTSAETLMSMNELAERRPWPLNQVQFEIAANPNAPPEFLEEQAQSFDAEMRETVSHNPSTPAQVRQDIEEGEERVRRADVSRDADELAQLAGDHRGYVRIEVAANAFTATETQVNLAVDPIEEVRSHLLSSSPPEVQAILADDPSEAIRHELIWQNSLPNELLQQMAKDDPAENVRDFAAKELRFVEEHAACDHATGHCAREHNEEHDQVHHYERAGDGFVPFYVTEDPRRSEASSMKPEINEETAEICDCPTCTSGLSVGHSVDEEDYAMANFRRSVANNPDRFGATEDWTDEQWEKALEEDEAADLEEWRVEAESYCSMDIKHQGCGCSQDELREDEEDEAISAELPQLERAIDDLFKGEAIASPETDGEAKEYQKDFLLTRLGEIRSDALAAHQDSPELDGYPLDPIGDAEKALSERLAEIRAQAAVGGYGRQELEAYQYRQSDSRADDNCFF